MTISISASDCSTPRCPEPARPLAWASLALSGLTVVLFLVPGLDVWLGYDRAAIANGQVWRLLTGHLTHWTFEHLFWSLLVFAGLGFLAERDGKRMTFLLGSLAAALGISAAVWFLLPNMTSYRGLSGVDCALVTLWGMHSLRLSLRAGQRRLSLALAAVLAAYFAKVAFEYTTGSTVFVDTVAGVAPFVPVPLAHLVGGLLGLLLGLRVKVHPRWREDPQVLALMEPMMPIL